MPGMKLLTKLDAQTSLKAAYRAAQDLGYTLTSIDDSSKAFTATKGSVLVSMIAGPFAPHCRFEISAASYADANEVVLEKNTPWLTTGSMGVGKVKKQADELIQAIANAIQTEGGEILERRAF